MLCHGWKRLLNHKQTCASMKRLICSALMPLSVASDLQLDPNAMAPDTDNINMRVLLWNVEGAKAMYNTTPHDCSRFDVLAFTETYEIMPIRVCMIIYCIYSITHII